MPNETEQSKSKDLTLNKPAEITVTASDPADSMSLYMDKSSFEQAWRAATMFSKSDLVPSHFKGKPENVMILFNMARRLNADPVMLMQKTYIIQGKPGMEGQLVIALVNSRGPFKGPIQWEFSGTGKDMACTAYAIHKDTDERCEATVTWKMAELEGWTKKAGSKWLTIPEQMFRYRSAVFLARLFCPEVIFGIQTVDEILDSAEITTDVPSEPQYERSPLEERLSRKVDSVVTETEKEPEPEPEKKPAAKKTAKKKGQQSLLDNNE